MSIVEANHELRKSRLKRLGMSGERREFGVPVVVDVTVRAFTGSPDGYIRAIDCVPPPPPPPTMEELTAAAARIQADMDALRLQLEAARQVASDPCTTAGEPVTPPPSIERILRTVCKYYDVKRVDVCSERRTADVTRPRQIAMYLCATVSGRSLPMIGRLLGNRDHTTALHGRDKIKKLRLVDASLNSELVELERILAAAP